MDPAIRFPSVADLCEHAHKRIPHFAWEYLDSGEGTEAAKHSNVAALQRVTITPRQLKGVLEPRPATTLFGHEYAMPFGISPVGLTGLIWPGADEVLARCAAANNIPYVSSTVSTGLMEEVGPMAKGRGWFQLYPPRNHEHRDDLIRRAQESDFGVMVVTSDVPAKSRRERQTRARIAMPPRITPGLVAQTMRRPAWALALLRNGMPRFRNLETYADKQSLKAAVGFVGASLGGTLSWDYLADVRAQWSGPLLIKGVLHPDDAQRAIDVGCEGVIVSNHGGRQLDSAPAAITALPAVVEKIGDQGKVLFDSGVRNGLDVVRAMALGADFTFSGRCFMYGLGAMGTGGPTHVAQLVHDEIITVMHQLGCDTFDQVRQLDIGQR